MNATGQTVCLCMIVKNEAPVIRRCLDSVRPVIDSWVIVDTGSTDGTQDIIHAHFKDLPGELIERPWRDFAHNRSEALDLARGRSDFTLIIDADDALHVPPGTRIPELTANAYTIEIDDSSTVYRRTQLVRSALPWRYEGVLHEYLTCDGAGPTDHLAEIRMRRNHDGARRKDPQTYRRDAALLEAALQTETSPFLLSRYRFYLAQSYRDCGERENALEHYLRRAELGFWQEEVFVSLYEAAKLKEQLGHPDQEVIEAYLRASDALPSRAEALHGACHFCRLKGRNEEGYRIGKRGLNIPLRSDALFVHPWIYEFGLRDEFAVNAYWAGHYRESLDASLHLLGSSTLPAGFRDRIAANARFALEKLPPQPGPDAVDAMIWPAGSRRSGILLPAPRSIPGMVSVITPTYNRAGFLKKALTYVRSQDYKNIEWLIIEDGQQETELFDGMNDKNISYERLNKKVSIGEKRNMLIEKARGEVIVQFDDDDYYAPNYISTMLAALATRDADLINLRGWFLYDIRSSFFGYWDLMEKEGPHYRCDQAGVGLIMLNQQNNQDFKNNHLGYGFSYAFKKKVWDSVKFPDVNWNEDGEFALKASAEFKVDGIHDHVGLCLHFLHPNSTSRCFPQHHLPEGLFAKLFPGLGDPAPSPAAQRHGPKRSPAPPALPPEIHLINLDRSTDRLATFKERNHHLENISRVSGTDGARLDRAELIGAGIIADDLLYLPGALGCALSHVGLWEKAASEDRVITIFEDDVFCSPAFTKESVRLVSSLPKDWDVMVWGFNFDPAFIWVDLGFSKAKLEFYRRRKPRDYQEFQAGRLSPSAVRLAHSFGTIAYSVSPKGARTLLKHCIPLRKRFIPFPGTNVVVKDEGIDMAMSGIYEKMQAFICIPPLVIHDQEQPSDRMTTDNR